MKNRKSVQRLVWGPASCLPGQYGAIPVYGGEPANRTQGNGIVTNNVELNPSDGSIPVPVEIDVSITTSLILASLPADGLKLTVDPTQESGIGRPPARITNPDVTVVNHSVVPVELEIAGIPGAEDVEFSGKFSSYAEQSFQLVDHISGVGPPGTTILVLGTQGRQYGSSGDFEHYAIYPEQTGIFVAKILAEQETVIRLYGKVTPDLYGEYELTVKPTLKISAAKVG